MKKIAVLGAGLVGKTIACDLNRMYDVCSVDIDDNALSSMRNMGIKTAKVDILNEVELKSIIKRFDLVIGAVPGFMGYNTLKNVIEAGKNYVDISFMPENAMDLNDLAIEKNVTVVTDCGVAPGMGNIILGYLNSIIKVTDYECLVGGLPIIRQWPFEYKAVFSPADVIEEYTRPARYIENHKIVTKEALSNLEHVNFSQIGTLESWNSDGLRSLLFTMPNVANLIEKTLRYPGTVNNIKVLRDSGFFSKQPISLNGIDISPLDFTSKILFPKWKLLDGEKDFTVMRIKISGSSNDGKDVTYLYNLYDEYDVETKTNSMSRTTGYTCSAVANIVINGEFSRKGVNPPEFVGPEHLQFILKYLEKRRVVYSLDIL